MAAQIAICAAFLLPWNQHLIRFVSWFRSGHRSLGRPLGSEGSLQMVLCGGVVGLESERLFEMNDGVVQVALFRQSGAQTAVRFGVTGIKAHCLLQLFNGFVQASPAR